MSEHAKFLGEGVSCAFCGEHQLGATAETVTMLSLEDFYLDETEFVIDPLKTIKDQLWPTIERNIPETYEAIQCPMCGETVDPEWNSEIVVGTLWECTDCNEVHDNENDAEECCSYQRQFAVQRVQQQQSNIMNARMLLEQEGYIVVPAQQQKSTAEILKGL